MERISRKINKNSNINILKEVGYILLLVVFFIGVLLGSISLKNVSDANFEEYKVGLEDAILKNSEKSFDVYGRELLFQNLKMILIFWIVGMSVVGSPFLIGMVGYKGFSIGYTISTMLKLLGTVEGNKYVFQNLFVSSVIITFFMIYMANYSIKISRNFFENKENLKIDVIKYTVISTFIAFLNAIIYFVLSMVF